MLVAVAWLVLVLNGINVLMMPMLIGRERTGTYTYSNFIGALLQLIFVAPLCFKAFGII